MRSSVFALTLLALVAALFVFSGCGNLDSETPKAKAGPANAVTVEVYNNEFKPSSVTIKAGGTVTWFNRDEILYSVTSNIFDQVVQINGTWQYTFNTPGTYQIHDRMSANPPSMTVIVQ